MEVQSDCGSNLSYTLSVSNPGSDGYTVTIFASNGCPGLAEEFGEWMHRHNILLH